MTIAEAREKCKGTLAKIPRDAVILGVLVLSSSASFGFGYMTGFEGVRGSLAPTETALPEAVLPTTGVVASKSGTKYYLPTCAAASRIAEANKVWFETKEAASAAGYSPAANCPGL